MISVSRRILLSPLALSRVPPVFSMLAPNPIQVGEIPSFLLATAAPTERLSPPVPWLNDLEHRMRTYFTKKYPSYDFSAYAEELDRIRGAVPTNHAGRGVQHFLSRIGKRAVNGRRSRRRLQ
jgi:hypothetical protein